MLICRSAPLHCHSCHARADPAYISYFLHPDLREHPTGLDCVIPLMNAVPALRALGVKVLWVCVLRGYAVMCSRGADTLLQELGSHGARTHDHTAFPRARIHEEWSGRLWRRASWALRTPAHAGPVQLRAVRAVTTPIPRRQGEGYRLLDS